VLTSDRVWLFDVDNTLLDNDRFRADLEARLTADFGSAGNARYWALFAALRESVSYADYLGALQRFRAGVEDDPRLLQLSGFMLDYPFAERLYPAALETLRSVARFGLTAVLSDGDVVFQPRKIQCSGVWDAVQGRVIITTHKELVLDAIRRRFPARHYVIVDDKPLLLAAMKRVLGSTLTTVFVRQGHYAAEAASLQIDPPPDRTIEHIGDLNGHDLTSYTAEAT
jgi:FMN phosphatase YigB (HAD superfamily)